MLAVADGKCNVEHLKGNRLSISAFDFKTVLIKSSVITGKEEWDQNHEVDQQDIKVSSI